MIKIYGSPRSSSGRCFWCLEEVGQPYAVVPVSFKDGEHKSEDFLKKNPNGKVPLLEDGEFKIWESMAINFYLVERYKPDLLGKTIEERSLVRQWSIWSIADVQHPLIQAFIQKVFVPDERRDHEKIEASIKKVKPYLSTLNNALSGGDYIVGDKFSLADLNVASVISICQAIDLSLSDYTNVTSWLARVEQREAYQRYTQLS